jgi:hypothetical protein
MPLDALRPYPPSLVTIRGSADSCGVKPLLVLALALLSACGSQPPFDYASACAMAHASASTPADLRRISDTINGANHAGNHNYQPKGSNVERWTAAVLLSEAARKAAVPYALPSYLQGNLPKQPDTAEVRALQRRLTAACA